MPRVGLANDQEMCFCLVPVSKMTVIELTEREYTQRIQENIYINQQAKSDCPEP